MSEFNVCVSIGTQNIFRIPSEIIFMHVYHHSSSLTLKYDSLIFFVIRHTKYTYNQSPHFMDSTRKIYSILYTYTTPSPNLYWKTLVFVVIFSWVLSIKVIKFYANWKIYILHAQNIRVFYHWIFGFL